MKYLVLLLFCGCTVPQTKHELYLSHGLHNQPADISIEFPRAPFHYNTPLTNWYVLCSTNMIDWRVGLVGTDYQIVDVDTNDYSCNIIPVNLEQNIFYRIAGDSL